MFFNKIKLTDTGRAMIALAVTGQETIHFTRLVLGSGEPQDAGSATELSSQIADGAITEIRHTGGTAELRVQYDNFGLQAGFIATELGIMAKDKDNVEYLYAYTTAAPGVASYIPSYEEAPATQYEFIVAVAVGDAEHVEAVIGEAGGYARKEELREHIENKSNPHGVTAADVGLGNVANVAVNDQRPTYKENNAVTALVSGEPMMTAFAKLATAIREVIRLGKEMKDLTAGEIGIQKGGTGGATAEAARKSLGLNTLAITRDVDAGTINFAANGSRNATVDLPQVEGYTPMAIAGWQIKSSGVAGHADEDIDPNNMWIGGNKLTAELVNRRTTANSCGFWARILYIKNT